MTRILAVLAILAVMAILAPSAAAAPEAQRHGGHGVHVGVHHDGFARHPFGFHPGFGFRAPGFGLAPFLPVAVAAPLVVPVAAPYAVPVPVSVPYAPPQVNYAPALTAPCGCPE